MFNVAGMHYGLQQACPQAEVVAAFDLNEVANDVYEYNFGWRPWQGNLEGVSASTLDDFSAQLWMMAPPCQPFTRRGLQRDTTDPRSASFLKLIGLLPSLQVRTRKMPQFTTSRFALKAGTTSLFYKPLTMEQQFCGRC